MHAWPCDLECNQFHALHCGYSCTNGSAEIELETWLASEISESLLNVYNILLGPHNLPNFKTGETRLKQFLRWLLFKCFQLVTSCRVCQFSLILLALSPLPPSPSSLPFLPPIFLLYSLPLILLPPHLILPLPLPLPVTFPSPTPPPSPLPPSPPYPLPKPACPTIYISTRCDANGKNSA